VCSAWREMKRLLYAMKYMINDKQWKFIKWSPMLNSRIFISKHQRENKFGGYIITRKIIDHWSICHWCYRHISKLAQPSWVILSYNHHDCPQAALVSFPTWFPEHCIYAQIHTEACEALWQGEEQSAPGMCVTSMMSWDNPDAFGFTWSLSFVLTST
jgi:uncharacterized membrane protein YhdT